MTKRVAYLPAGANTKLRFEKLGTLGAGEWGLVPDADWLNAEFADPLELLYLSVADYEKAIQGLPGNEISLAIEKRKKVFSDSLPDCAMGLVEEQVLRLVPRIIANQTNGSRLGSDLLEALALITLVPRYTDCSKSELIQYLLEGEAELLAELELALSSTSGPKALIEDEFKVRTRFGTELSTLNPSRDPEDDPSLLPVCSLERVCLISPHAPEIEHRAKAIREPFLRWRDDLIVPLLENEIQGLESPQRKIKVLFASMGAFLEAKIDLTPAQLDFAVLRAIDSSDIKDHVNMLRLQQALLRKSVHSLFSCDSEFANLLIAQSLHEMARLPSWSSEATMVEKQAPLKSDFRGIIDAARLLMTLCRRKQGYESVEKFIVLIAAIERTEKLLET